MELNEALATLKKAGLIAEDTDTWDAADMPAGMTQKQREKMADVHNKNHRGIFSRIYTDSVWCIKIIAAADDKDDKFIGYLLPNGTVKEKFSDECMMNYNKCCAVRDKFATEGEEMISNKSRLGILLRQWTQLDKEWTFYLTPGTLKNGKFYEFNNDFGYAGQDI